VVWENATPTLLKTA